MKLSSHPHQDPRRDCLLLAPETTEEAAILNQFIPPDSLTYAVKLLPITTSDLPQFAVTRLAESAEATEEWWEREGKHIKRPS